HHDRLRSRHDPQGGQCAERAADRVGRLRLATTRDRCAGGRRLGGGDLLDVPVYRQQPDQAAQPSGLARPRRAGRAGKAELGNLSVDRKERSGMSAYGFRIDLEPSVKLVEAEVLKLVRATIPTAELKRIGPLGTDDRVSWSCWIVTQTDAERDR